MITLIDLAFGVLQGVLAVHGPKLPAGLVESIQAAVDAWAAHRDDVVTKAALEAQRG